MRQQYQVTIVHRASRKKKKKENRRTSSVQDAASHAAVHIPTYVLKAKAGGGKGVTGGGIW